MDRKASMPDGMLPADELRRVLARAAELEAARDTGVSVAELQRLAGEVGISPDAVTLALQEWSQQRALPAPSRARRWIAAVQRAGLAVGAAVLTVVSIAANGNSFGPESSLVVLGATGGFALLRGVRARLGRAPAGVQGDVAAVGAGLAAALGALHGFDGLQVGATWWLICAAVAFAAARVRLELRPAPHAADPGAP